LGEKGAGGKRVAQGGTNLQQNKKDIEETTRLCLGARGDMQTPRMCQTAVKGDQSSRRYGPKREVESKAECYEKKGQKNSNPQKRRTTTTEKKKWRAEKTEFKTTDKNR